MEIVLQRKVAGMAAQGPWQELEQPVRDQDITDRIVWWTRLSVVNGITRVCKGKPHGSQKTGRWPRNAC